MNPQEVFAASVNEFDKLAPENKVKAFKHLDSISDEAWLRREVGKLAIAKRRRELARWLFSPIIVRSSAHLKRTILIQNGFSMDELLLGDPPDECVGLSFAECIRYLKEHSPPPPDFVPCPSNFVKPWVPKPPGPPKFKKPKKPKKRKRKKPRPKELQRRNKLKPRPPKPRKKPKIELPPINPLAHLQLAAADSPAPNLDDL